MVNFSGLDDERQFAAVTVSSYRYCAPYNKSACMYPAAATVCGLKESQDTP